MRAEKRYYLNADRSKVVDEDSPDAAFLLAAAGTDISTADVRRYGLNKPDPEPGPAPEPEAKAVEKPPENKAQKMGEKK